MLCSKEADECTYPIIYLLNVSLALLFVRVSLGTLSDSIARTVLDIPVYIVFAIREVLRDFAFSIPRFLLGCFSYIASDKVYICSCSSNTASFGTVEVCHGGFGNTVCRTLVFDLHDSDNNLLLFCEFAEHSVLGTSGYIHGISLDFCDNNLSDKALSYSDSSIRFGFACLQKG